MDTVAWCHISKIGLGFGVVRDGIFPLFEMTEFKALDQFVASFSPSNIEVTVSTSNRVSNTLTVPPPDPQGAPGGFAGIKGFPWKRPSGTSYSGSTSLTRSIVRWTMSWPQLNAANSRGVSDSQRQPSSTNKEGQGKRTYSAHSPHTAPPHHAPNPTAPAQHYS